MTKISFSVIFHKSNNKISRDNLHHKPPILLLVKYIQNFLYRLVCLIYLFHNNLLDSTKLFILFCQKQMYLLYYLSHSLFDSSYSLKTSLLFLINRIYELCKNLSKKGSLCHGFSVILLLIIHSLN